MNGNEKVLAAEDSFFAALLGRDRDSLERVVGDDCVLIDVLSGSEVSRSAFLDLVGSGRVVFESIERVDARVRLYGSTAVVTGQTRMAGQFETQRFHVHSRYAHVYVNGRQGWRLVNAQGTPIAERAA